MEAACRGAAEAGGESVGVLLAAGGEPNSFVTRRVVARDLGARLGQLRDLAGAWIFLPRGLGTMLELVFIAESVVKRETRPRPLVLLGDFWHPMLEKAISEASDAAGSAALRSSARMAVTAAEAASVALPG